MKRKLLFGAMLFASVFSANAQLPIGSQAPDFTLTDQWGDSHTLSTYLAAGKTVIIDISATWCGPCWSAHQAHVLKDIHNAYGPDASDEIVVLFLEGDDQTTTADLNGTGGNTQGDWITGTPYPVLDNAGAQSNSYDIAGFPQFYVICPDGTVAFEQAGYSGSLGADLLSAADGCSTLNGVADHAELNDGAAYVCSTTGDVMVDFNNYGNNAITAATLELSENGNVIATENFSGNIASMGSGTATFSGITVNPANTYTAEITTINGNAPANANLTEADVEVEVAELSGTAITVNCTTDNYPGEISWEIRNSANQVVASGGPYTPGTDDQWGGGGPDALTTISSGHTLPAGADCYKVVMMDAFGDGWGLVGSSPTAGIEVVSWGNQIVDIEVGNFGSELTRDAALRTDASSGLGDINIENVSIYPNPASDLINVEFNSESSDYTVSLMDLSGRVLLTESGSQNVTFEVGEFAQGSYLVTISSAEGTVTENVVIK